MWNEKDEIFLRERKFENIVSSMFAATFFQSFFHRRRLSSVRERMTKKASVRCNEREDEK